MINRLLRRIAKPAKSRQFNRTLDAGISYLNGGQLEKALASFDELIRIDPSDAQAYRLKGSLYTVARDYDRALINYDKAVELGDTVFDATYGDVEAYIARGHTHTRKSEYGKAAEDFKEALDLDSVYVESHCRAAYELGVSLDRSIPFIPYDIISINKTAQHYGRCSRGQSIQGGRSRGSLTDCPVPSWEWPLTELQKTFMT